MDRCPQCPGINKCVSPSGVPCDVMFISEAPGPTETDKGQLLIGKPGKEFNEHYLPLAGLRRNSVYITSAIKCLSPSVGGKLDISNERDRDLLQSCANHFLPWEIQDVSPRVIVPLGNFACKALDPNINLELQHGIPMDTAFGPVFPMYHPAGGLHEPKKMFQIRNDFARLRKYLHGTLRIPKDVFTHPDYRVIENDELLDMYIHGREKCNALHSPLAIDTEITRQRKPFCMTFSMAPGTGYLIRADNTDALEIFDAMLATWRGPILFHNYPFDGPVCAAMGLHIPHERIVDTMMRCFHLGSLPQGLKALAYRLLGMTMQSFDDVVTPYSTPLCLEYLRDAYNLEWERPPEQVVREKNGDLKLYKPQSMTIKLKRFLSDFGKNPDKDVYEAWSNWEEQHRDIEEKMERPWPGKCISYVPFEKTIYYACRDADATIRLWPLLEHMRRMTRKKLAEYWEMEAA